MAWIQVHQQLKDHRKLLAAADELEIEPPHMLGLLTSFWLWALDNAPSGSLEGISNRNIARAAQWNKEPDTFVEAMKKMCIRDRARRFKHLTKTDRLRMEQQLKDGKGAKEIAENLGVHISTIYREKKRGQYEHRNSDWTTEIRYSPDIAHDRYRENLKAKGPELKLGKDRKLAEYIEHKIADEQYSPAAVLGRIKAKGLKFNTTISVNTLYSYIEKGVFLRITNKDLPVKGSRKREYRHTKAQSRAPKGESIEKRPEEINNRETFGHWEMDCVESAKGCTTTLLVLTERLSRREITRRMEAKKAENVVAELDALEKRYGELFPLIFKSITVDNGSEFANLSLIHI